MPFASREKAVLWKWGVAVMPSDRRRAPIPRRPPAPSGCWCKKNTPANTGIEVLGRVDVGDRNHDDRVVVIAPVEHPGRYARSGPRRGPRYSRSAFVICTLAQLLAAAGKSRRARALNPSGPGAVDISCENFGRTRRSTRRFLRRNLSPQLRDALVLDGLPPEWRSTARRP
jgi:hypothetical protein